MAIKITLLIETHTHIFTDNDMWFLTLLMNSNVQEVTYYEEESHFLAEDTLQFPQSLTSQLPFNFDVTFHLSFPSFPFPYILQRLHYLLIPVKSQLGQCAPIN